MLKRIFAVFLVSLLPVIGFVQAEGEPLSIWTSGQIDADNSVYYSVLLSSGEEAVTDITVSAMLPEGATFAQEFWKPEAAEFAGESDGTVSWTLAELPANSIVGPFTFQVTFEGSDSEDFAPPADVKAMVTSSAGDLESAVTETTLAAMETSGTVEVTAEGSMDMVMIGNTGVWAYVPTGAVADTVNVTVERLAFTDDMALPEVAEETWWCGLLSISADKDVEFGAPIIVTVPLRRPTTPGLVMPVFMQTAEGEWELVSSESSLEGTFSEEDAVIAKVAASGTDAYIIFNAAKLGTTPMTFAVGVNIDQRTYAVTTIQPVTTITYPTSPAAAWQQDWF